MLDQRFIAGFTGWSFDQLQAPNYGKAPLPVLIIVLVIGHHGYSV